MFKIIKIIKKITNPVPVSILKFRSIFQTRAYEDSPKTNKSYDRYRRIFLTGGSAAGVKVISAVINLITVPLTLDYLGPERFGLWMAISSIIVLLSFADLGLGNGLLNAISKAHGKNSIRDAAIAVSSTFYMLFILSISLLIIFFFIYPHISWNEVFNVKGQLATEEVGPTVAVLIIIFLINMPLGVIERIYNGYQEGYIFQSWLIFGSIFSLLGILLSIYLQAGLPWLVFAFSSGQLVATLLNGLYLFFKHRKSLKPNIYNFKFDIAKHLLNAGGIFFLLNFLTLAGNASDNIILAHTLGPSSVAAYEIVKKIFIFTLFAQFFLRPFWPAFGEAIESGDHVWAKNALHKGIKISLFFTALISLPFLLFGKQIIMIWIGSDFIPSWSLLIGFYVYALISSYAGVMSSFLNSGHLIRKQLLIIFLASASSIILKIVLSTNFGVSGVIWATIISYSIFYIVPSYLVAYNYLKEQ